MKRFLAFFVVLVGITLFLSYLFPFGNTLQPVKKGTTPTITPSTTPIPAASLQQTLFVPYWTLNSTSLPTTYTTLAYFGITASTQGIDTKENGYLDLPKFVSLSGRNQKILLVVRLVDSEVNTTILQDKALQQKIVTQTITTAKQYGFTGVVLDLEYHALSFGPVVHSLTDFSTLFATNTHQAHLLYYQALYGDTFYRARPFDVAAIGKVSDGIYVMAYDFHKASGNPGPNFPLHMLSDEDYSFGQMVKDFTSKVPAKKIAVVFGLFGYDWPVDDKGRSTDQGSSLTHSQIKNKIGPPCTLSACVIKHDMTSAETEVLYKDSSGARHVIWFEDMQSMARKEMVLREYGISSAGLWAYSYF